MFKIFFIIESNFTVFQFVVIFPIVFDKAINCVFDNNEVFLMIGFGSGGHVFDSCDFCGFSMTLTALIVS